MKRIQVALSACVVLALVVSVGAAMAGGGNKTGQHCQKNKWQTLTSASGTAFSGEEGCTSFVARGGTLVVCTLTGTPGDDTWQANDVSAADTVCGFGGDDHVGELVAGASFYGGPGSDGGGSISGTFRGGAGEDFADRVYGTFDGGDDRDFAAELFAGGTFNGGGGSDLVFGQAGGTFSGGDDGDAVRHLLGGSFNGEAGSDFVQSIGAGATFDGGDGDDTFCTNSGGTVISAVSTGCV
jgi:hypothetical protein